MLLAILNYQESEILKATHESKVLKPCSEPSGHGVLEVSAPSPYGLGVGPKAVIARQQTVLYSSVALNDNKNNKNSIDKKKYARYKPIAVELSGFTDL